MAIVNITVWIFVFIPPLSIKLCSGQYNYRKWTVTVVQRFKVRHLVSLEPCN